MKLSREKRLRFGIWNDYFVSGSLVDGEWNNNLLEHGLIKYSKNHSNLLITPHIGGATIESINGARIFMANKVADYLKNNF